MSKVLVVDDVESELEIICRILQDAGMEVIRANDGEEAIARIREAPHDYIQTCLNHPGDCYISRRLKSRLHKQSPPARTN